MTLGQTKNNLFLVKSESSSSPSSCAVLCSNLRVGREDSCNIYFLDNGLCKAGVLDNPSMYSKPVGSSKSLVEVKVLASAITSSVGTRVKPGKQSGFCWKDFHTCIGLILIMSFLGKRLPIQFKCGS